MYGCFIYALVEGKVLNKQKNDRLTQSVVYYCFILLKVVIYTLTGDNRLIEQLLRFICLSSPCLRRVLGISITI